MSKINEIMSEVLDTELYDDDDIRACTLYNVKAEQVVECMRKYAEVLLKEIEENTNYYTDINEVHGCINVRVDEFNWSKLRLI